MSNPATSIPTASNPRGIAVVDDEARLAQLGYKQELHRRLSGFSNFAVSFSTSLDATVAGGPADSGTVTNGTVTNGTVASGESAPTVAAGE